FFRESSLRYRVTLVLQARRPNAWPVTCLFAPATRRGQVRPHHARRSVSDQGVIGITREPGSKPKMASAPSVYRSASAPLPSIVLPPPLPVTVKLSRRGTPLPLSRLVILVL